LAASLLNTDFNFVPHPPIKTQQESSYRTSTHGVNEKRADDVRTLSQFQSLAFPLSRSKLIGLYFAASWCPMSTSVTHTLEEIFSKQTSNQDTSLVNRILSNEDANKEHGQQKDFSLVYVSSDYSDKEMKSYMKWNWIGIPFDSPDRNDIKRHFRICAQNEMEELGIHPRRFQIPTLVVLDSATQAIITTDGAADIANYREEVLEHWLEIQSLMRALEDKYEEP
jgi:hypothetical protein